MYAGATVAGVYTPATYTVSAGQPTSGTPPTFTGYSGSPAFVTPTGQTTDQLTGVTVTPTQEQPVSLGYFDEGLNTSISYGGASAIDRGVQCPGSNALTCVSTGSGSAGAIVASGSGNATWSATTLGARTHVNQVACTTAATAVCVGVGRKSTAGAIFSTASNFAAATTDGVPTTPNTLTDFTQVTCPSSDGCYAVATSANGPVLVAGRVTTGGDQWSEVSLPVAVSAIDSIACATATVCEMSYTSTTSTPGVLQLVNDPATLSPGVSSDTIPPMVTSIGAITCPSAADCVATAIGDQTSSDRRNRDHHTGERRLDPGDLPLRRICRHRHLLCHHHLPRHRVSDRIAGRLVE